MRAVREGPAGCCGFLLADLALAMAMAEETGWRTVDDAYGPADKIPALLDALDSSDGAKRRAAIDDLWTRLCHQETVYTASAAAVPLLAAAVTAGRLPPLSRALVCGLIVYIGRGEDSCWEGYVPLSTVEACVSAVAGATPELVAWAQRGAASDQAFALQLGAYHPSAFTSAQVDACSLATDHANTAVLAGARLARTLIAGEVPELATIAAAAATDNDALDWYEHAVAGQPAAKQARLLATELLDKASEGLND